MMKSMLKIVELMIVLILILFVVLGDIKFILEEKSFGVDDFVVMNVAFATFSFRLSLL